MIPNRPQVDYRPDGKNHTELLPPSDRYAEPEKNTEDKEDGDDRNNPGDHPPPAQGGEEGRRLAPFGTPLAFFGARVRHSRYPLIRQVQEIL